MTYKKDLLVLFLTVLVLDNYCVYGSAIVKNQNEQNNSFGVSVVPERRFVGENEERYLEQEIFQELNHLSVRKQRQIYDDLEKQREHFNSTQKSIALSDPESLSPLNVEELKNIKKTIKTPNSSIPPIRNKRTLNLLLSLVARAMGYTLTPSNPDAEWIPRQRPQSPPCPTTPPPCTPSTPAPNPPPCAMPPTAPPCRGSTAMQPATVPSNQVDANTISYPYRPARTIPLLNFAPLPQGIRVPYPPLFQPPAQRSPCAPSPPPPCGATPAPPPCGTTPAPSPPPCGTTPAPPPCGTTPAPRPPPCGASPAPPPCATPAPPCTTPAPKPPPCSTPAPSPPPCGTTPAPTQPPCAPPAPKPSPCGASPPCGAAPPPPTSKPKGSILLEYDDPVRIQIFSNEKKYLPASGNIFSGHDDGYDERTYDHLYFFPKHDESRKKDDKIEEEEMQEEHVEAEEEEEEEPSRNREDENLRYREEADELSANNEEDESEINLSVIKNPSSQNSQKRRRLVSTKSTFSKKNHNDAANDATEEKTLKMKKPKRKKWVRIVKKQRRKTKTDSSPVENYQIYSSDNVQDGSSVSQVFERSTPEHSFHSYDTYPKFDGSESQANTNHTHVELKKVIINGREVSPTHVGRGARGHDVSLRHLYTPETSDERRKKLEMAVEKYVEDYVEKQLGDELLKNTGVPKTTIFNFEPKNGPRIQTITTTVAKSTRNGVPVSFSPQFRPETKVRFGAPQVEGNPGTARVVQRNSFEENLKKKGNVSYEAFATRS